MLSALLLHQQQQTLLLGSISGELVLAEGAWWGEYMLFDTMNDAAAAAVHHGCGCALALPAASTGGAHSLITGPDASPCVRPCHCFMCCLLSTQGCPASCSRSSCLRPVAVNSSSSSRSSNYCSEVRPAVVVVVVCETQFKLQAVTSITSMHTPGVGVQKRDSIARSACFGLSSQAGPVA